MSLSRSSSWSFNSRSRAASDLAYATTTRSKIVSTHARARRATEAARASKVGLVVSTHARARRATYEADGVLRACMFQLTLARGERPMIASSFPVPGVSTHARARRATAAPRISPGTCSFNSRSRAASDFYATRCVNAGNGFNSRSRAASDLGRTIVTP